MRELQNIDLNLNNLYHNNFINNGTQVTRHIYEPFLHSYLSLFEEYPTGGNYWSGHMSEDNYSGPNQDQPGPDGIADAPYGDVDC